MREYEALVIFSSELGDEGVNESLERLGQIVESGGGEMLLTGQLANLKGDVAELPEGEGWKPRKLAYQIGGHKEGYYVVARFNSESATPAELERVWQLSEDVIRYMILRAPDQERED